MASLANPLIALPIWNNLVPTAPDGSPAPNALQLFADFDFTSLASFTFDLTQEVDGGVIGFIQACYINNKNNVSAVTLLTGPAGQDVTVKARTQGYYPLFTSDPPVFTVSVAATGVNQLTRIHFVNVMLPSFQWLTQ